MSVDTSGSSVASKIPRKAAVRAAFLKAAFIFSGVVFFFTIKVKSQRDPQGVGTRMARPSKRPLRPFMTLAVAEAAPVVVGTIFTPAARARRKSRCKGGGGP